MRVALSRTARWLRSLGRLAGGFAAADPSLADVADLIEESDSGFGRLSAVSHAGRLTGAPPRWSLPSVPLGSHEPRWSDVGSRS